MLINLIVSEHTCFVGALRIHTNDNTTDGIFHTFPEARNLFYEMFINIIAFTTKLTKLLHPTNFRW